VRADGGRRAKPAGGRQARHRLLLERVLRALSGARGRWVSRRRGDPGGRPAVVDPESLDEKYWSSPAELERARHERVSLRELAVPLSLAEARARQEEFQGLVVPGGQGVMVDLLDDPDLQALLIAFDANDRPVGLVCHAPALLTRFPEGQRPFAGSRVTSVSAFEEWYIETFV